MTFGSPALPRSVFAESESLISSDTVVDAFFDQLERDYRGAIRSSLEATNPQMNHTELQERVIVMVAHSEPEALLGRVRNWSFDEPLELSEALGDRLTVLISEVGQAQPWFPDSKEMEAITRRLLPDATVVWVPDGPSSRPDAAAAAIREMTARI